MAINRGFGIPTGKAEVITELSAIERKRRAAQEQQYQDQQDQGAAAGQGDGVQYSGGKSDEEIKRDEQEKAGEAALAAKNKLYDYSTKTSRVQNAESAKGALSKLLQTQQDSPEARAANAANLKSKAAQATLAQKANVGVRGMTASGFGASQVAGQERLGGQAVSKGMTAYDMDKRQEEQARKTSTMGMIGGLQRNELEAEAFLRAQAELNQGDRSKDIGTVITVSEVAGNRATIVSSVPNGAKPVNAPIQKINGKEYRIYTTKEGDNIAVQETGLNPTAGR